MGSKTPMTPKMRKKMGELFGPGPRKKVTPVATIKYQTYLEKIGQRFFAK